MQQSPTTAARLSQPALQNQPPDTHREIISRDPATNDELGRVPVITQTEIENMLARARAAQTLWARQSFNERARIILRARQIVLDEMDEIATLITRESGKPFAESVSMEIIPTLDLMQFFARNAARILKSERIALGQYTIAGRTSRIIYKPLGVIAIIAPWNFPWAIPLGEVVMALMAGNSVVLKPSELTSLVGLKIKDVFTRAGLGDDLLQIATGDGATGAALAASPSINKIMFTGSVATGKRVAAAAAQNLTPVVLELGGKDPMIICHDADLTVAAHAAVWGAFANSGQACASVERCYVHESVAAEFTNLVVTATKNLRQHHGTNEASDVAAMSSERQAQIVDAHISDALTRGARILTGGKRNHAFDSSPDDSHADAHNGDAHNEPRTNLFYEPTILTDVDDAMLMMHEETFGPVLPIKTFRTEDEAVGWANDSPFGLTASVWTRDLKRGVRLAASVDAGTVTINEVLYTHGLAATPWGGIKQSGTGRTHGKQGLLELVYPQHIHTNRLPRFADLWWFNYTPSAHTLFRQLARRATNGSILQSALAFPAVVRRFLEMRRRG